MGCCVHQNPRNPEFSVKWHDELHYLTSVVALGTREMTITNDVGRANFA